MHALVELIVLLSNHVLLSVYSVRFCFIAVTLRCLWFTIIFVVLNT